MSDLSLFAYPNALGVKERLEISSFMCVDVFEIGTFFLTHLGLQIVIGAIWLAGLMGSQFILIVS